MRQSSTEEEPVEQQPRLQRRPPNLCYNRNFRRLGDLSEEEQRSVVALICNKVVLSFGDKKSLPGSSCACSCPRADLHCDRSCLPG